MTWSNPAFDPLRRISITPPCPIWQHAFSKIWRTCKFLSQTVPLPDVVSFLIHSNLVRSLLCEFLLSCVSFSFTALILFVSCPLFLLSHHKAHVIHVELYSQNHLKPSVPSASMPSFTSLLGRGKKQEVRDGSVNKRRSNLLSLLRPRSQRVPPSVKPFLSGRMTLSFALKERFLSDIDADTWVNKIEILNKPEPPTKHVSTVPNSEKPLPPPPKPGSELEDPLPKPPIIKLDRIMSPLKDKDICSLFSGAPQFFVRAEANTGAPLPSIEFPWSEEILSRNLIDYKQIEHDALKCSSTYSRYNVWLSRSAHLVQSFVESPRWSKYSLIIEVFMNNWLFMDNRNSHQISWCSYFLES